MEANIRVSVSGVGEAEQQLRNFSDAVSNVSRNAQQSVGGESINLESIINKITQKTGGIDPFRSVRDQSKFSRELQQNYIDPAEKKRTFASNELKSIESYKQTISQQLNKGDISDEDYSDTLKELNKETEFYNNELNKSTDSLKRFNDILAEVAKINQEISSGERDSADAPEGTRRLGTLESLGLQRTRTEYRLQRESNVVERNKLAASSRENLKNVVDVRSDKILTTNQRTVYNPAFQGASNVVSSIGGGIGGSFGEIADTAMNFTRDIREAFTLDLARAAGSVITAGANLTASYAKMTIPKMMELETSQAETGKIGGVVSRGAYSLGMNAAETNRALQGSYRSLGVGDANIGINAMRMEAGSGVGVGGFSELFQSFKHYSSDNQDVLGEVGQAVSILGKSGLINMSTGDFSRMQEGTRLISQVDAMQTGRFTNVDVTKSASVVSGLEQLGGTFRGNSGMGKFQSIDQSITNPKNEFVKATLYRALMAENPNMSMRELEKRTEAGALGKGNLNAFIKQIGSQSGLDTEKATSNEMLSNDMFVRNLKFATGLNYDDTEGLIKNGRSMGKGAFDIFDQKKGDNISGALMGRGNTVGEITMLNKKLDDVLANQQGDMAKNFIRQTTKFIENPEKYLAESILTMPSIISSKLREALSGIGGVISSAIKDIFGFGDKPKSPTGNPNMNGATELLEFWGKSTDNNTAQLQQLNTNIQGLNNALQKAEPIKNQLQKGIK